MSKYIVSTMTNAVSYTIFSKIRDKIGDLPTIKKKITIWGGAGIPSNKSGFGDLAQDKVQETPLWTAQGIVTPVSDENFEILKEHWLFKKHLDAGRVRVVNEDLRGNHKAVKKVVTNMEKSDRFAQLNKDTLKMKVKVTTIKMEEETGLEVD
jgi:hypothetical protein